MFSDNFGRKIPVLAQEIFKTFREAYFEVNFIGDCVREFLTNAKIAYFEICTDASIEDILDVLEKYKKTNSSIVVKAIFKEVFFKQGDLNLIISSYPKKGLEEHLKKKYFTINSMLYDGTSVIDSYGGLKDIESGLIRLIGVPESDRNSHVPMEGITILRGIYLSAALGYEIEDRTLLYMHFYYMKLSDYSFEDLSEEIVKILNESIASEYTLLLFSKILEKVYPEYFDFIYLEQKKPEVFNEALKVLKSNFPISFKMAILFRFLMKNNGLYEGEIKMFSPKAHRFFEEKIKECCENFLIVPKETIKDILLISKAGNKIIEENKILNAKYRYQLYQPASTMLSELGDRAEDLYFWTSLYVSMVYKNKYRASRTALRKINFFLKIAQSEIEAPDLYPYKETHLNVDRKDLEFLNLSEAEIQEFFKTSMKNITMKKIINNKNRLIREAEKYKKESSSSCHNNKVIYL